MDDLFGDLARQTQRKRIVVYVHGGLEKLAESNLRSSRLIPEITASDPTAYPIFINWEAGLGNSYFRHLFYERNGISYHGTSTALQSALTSPLVFFADLGRGFCRLPINTVGAFSKMSQNYDSLYESHPRLYPTKNRFNQTLQQFSDNPAADPEEYHYFREGLVYNPTTRDRPRICVALGKDLTKRFRPTRLAGTILTTPLQFTTEPVLDAFGTPAWQNMRQRTRSMFYPAGNFITRKTTGESIPQLATEAYRGAAGIFFDRLYRFLNAHPDFQLDMIAHSTGTIVLNEVYREWPDLRTRNLVYMGAACSIREFQSSAGEHIRSHSTEFYDLCLHPRGDLEEVHAVGLPVRGSLLVWIDQFFQSPASFGDRTLGTFENAVIGYQLLPQNKRVHLKAFRFSTEHKATGFGAPRYHSEFENFKFWEPDFWATTNAPDKSYPLNQSSYTWFRGDLLPQ